MHPNRIINIIFFSNCGIKLTRTKTILKTVRSNWTSLSIIFQKHTLEVKNWTGKIQIELIRNVAIIENIRIKEDVRQGCILSPNFYNLLVEKAFSESTLSSLLGIRANAIFINNIRYTDYTLIKAGCAQYLQNLLIQVNQED